MDQLFSTLSVCTDTSQSDIQLFLKLMRKRLFLDLQNKRHKSDIDVHDFFFPHRLLNSLSLISVVFLLLFFSLIRCAQVYIVRNSF